MMNISTANISHAGAFAYAAQHARTLFLSGIPEETPPEYPTPIDIPDPTEIPDPVPQQDPVEIPVPERQAPPGESPVPEIEPPRE